MQGDIPMQMANCLNKLTEDCVKNVNGDVSEQEDALDLLSDIVEDINFACGIKIFFYNF